MDSLESQKAADESKPDAAELENSAEHDLSSAKDKERLPSQAEGTEGKEKQPYQRRRKLYQALARIEGSLKVKEDDLVIITKGDKAEFQVAQIRGQHTAMRLLKRAANQRQGFYSFYPHSESQVVSLINFSAEGGEPHPEVPPADRMFICGKLISKDEDAFLVDIGRNRRTHKAKKQISMPLRIAGKVADPIWTLGQWIGLVLHRQGTNWVWTGETRAVLESSSPKVKKEG